MRKQTTFARQRGTALVIGLILLGIITLLAVVGLNMSNSELASATSEQLRLRAFQAAETGIERGIAGIDTIATSNENVGVTGAVVNIEGSPTNPATGQPQDSYQLVNTYRGCSTFNAGAGKNAVSFHFTIQSTGRSARNAIAVNTQGVYVMNTVDTGCL